MSDRRSAVVQRYQLPAFFILTFAISWTLWLGLAAAALPITTTTGAVLNVVAIAGPSIAAVLLTIRLGQFRELLAGFSLSRLSARWSAVALGLPLALIAIAIAASIALLLSLIHI